jgi:hypothetical protein
MVEMVADGSQDGRGGVDTIVAIIKVPGYTLGDTVYEIWVKPERSKGRTS